MKYQYAGGSQLTVLTLVVAVLKEKMIIGHLMQEDVKCLRRGCPMCCKVSSRRCYSSKLHAPQGGLDILYSAFHHVGDEQCLPCDDVSCAPHAQANLVELMLAVDKLVQEGTTRPDHGCGVVEKINERL